MKKYLILVLIFNNYISFSQEEFGFSAASLAGIENNWIDSADCIYGNCYDGFGMLSNDENFYFGEFENGKSVGITHIFTKSNDITYYSNYANILNGDVIRIKKDPRSSFIDIELLEFENNQFKSKKY